MRRELCGFQELSGRGGGLIGEHGDEGIDISEFGSETGSDDVVWVRYRIARDTVMSFEILYEVWMRMSLT